MESSLTLRNCVFLVMLSVYLPTPSVASVSALLPDSCSELDQILLQNGPKGEAIVADFRLTTKLLDLYKASGYSAFICNRLFDDAKISASIFGAIQRCSIEADTDYKRTNYLKASTIFTNFLSGITEAVKTHSCIKSE